MGLRAFPWSSVYFFWSKFSYRSNFYLTPVFFPQHQSIGSWEPFPGPFNFHFLNTLTFHLACKWQVCYEYHIT